MSKKEKTFDDMMTVVGDDLSSSSSYITYKSDYNTDINMDKRFKNRLLNLKNDSENLFKLKNDFYTNFGDFLYNEALKEYNSLYDKNVYECYDRKLYNECQEIVLTRCEKRAMCYTILFHNKKKTDQEVDDMYNTLHSIKIESNQVRLWLQCVDNVKYYNNLHKRI